MSSECRIVTPEKIDPNSNIQLLVDGKPVSIQVIQIISDDQKKDESLEAELKEAYLAIEKDRQELNKDWDAITGEQWD